MPDETLMSLRERIEVKLRRQLNKLYGGELSELVFPIDFHGDALSVRMVKGHRVDTVASLIVTYRNCEAGRRDGFSVRRDLTWTIDAILREVGL